MNKIPTVAALLIKDGKVLLVREEAGSGHITGMHGIPSGRVDERESEIDAAVREFGEETGLFAEKKDLSEFPNNYYEASIPRKDGTVKTFTWRVFKVSNFSGELKGGSETTPIWVDIEKLDELEKDGRLLPNTINAVKAATTS